MRGVGYKLANVNGIYMNGVYFFKLSVRNALNKLKKINYRRRHMKPLLLVVILLALAGAFIFETGSCPG